MYSLKNTNKDIETPTNQIHEKNQLTHIGSMTLKRYKDQALEGGSEIIAWAPKCLLKNLCARHMANTPSIIY